MILEVLISYSVLFFRQDTSFQDHCADWGERGTRADGGSGGPIGPGVGAGGLGWGGLGGLVEGEAPVEDLGGVLEAGEGAGGRGAEDDADEGAAVADGFEEEGVGGGVGVAGFDAG